MMGYYQDICDTYGIHAARLLKQWANTNKKLANCKNRLIFLLRCRKSKILPRHIIDGRRAIHQLVLTNDGSMISKVDQFITKLGSKMLSLEIKITCGNISRLERFLEVTKRDVIKLIPNHVVMDYELRQKANYDKWFNKIKNNNIIKYNTLANLFESADVLFHNNEKWFKNISGVQIPRDIADFLSLGPKFGIPVSKDSLRIDRFLAEVENIIDEIPDSARDISRARVTNLVTNYLQNYHDNEPSKFNYIHKKTRKFLKEHPEVYLLQADKGGCTVVMDKDEYISKTEALLSDLSTYIPLVRDPTTTIQTTYNNLIKELKTKKEISEEVAKHLTIYNSNFPKLYCLPKIHKPGIPLRPIVSSVNATTYNISKFLSNILKHALAESTDYNIKDTFTFVNVIDNFKLPDNYVLISLDVVSLFTNIPVELILGILENKWTSIETYTSLTKNNFLRLIKFIFENTYFGFNEKFYKQIFGTPMGSPISAILATIVLDQLLNMVLPKLPFNIPFIYKYVDDIICAVPANKTQCTLNTFNSFNKHLQFTMELENDRSVPFLDTRVIRTEDSVIRLNWYQKPTASGRFVNYYSNHPTRQKYNSVISLKNRVIHISHESFIQANLNILFKMFHNNGYPAHILRRLIYNSNIFDGPTEETYNEVKYKKLPFVRGLTDSVISVFKRYTHIKISKYNSLSNYTLFTQLKQKPSLLYNTDVIYKLSCLGCDSCYVGQTSQWLKQRVTQHKSDCLIGKKSCAVVDHHQKTGHRFDFLNVRILERERNYKNRLFLEVCHINRQKNCVNYKSDMNKLSVIYCNVLNFDQNNFTTFDVG